LQLLKFGGHCNLGVSVVSPNNKYKMTKMFNIILNYKINYLHISHSF
jgi:hypothetical protein